MRMPDKPNRTASTAHSNIFVPGQVYSRQTFKNPFHECAVLVSRTNKVEGHDPETYMFSVTHM